MAFKTVSIDAVQLVLFKIETKPRQHVVLVEQPIVGGGTNSSHTPNIHNLMPIELNRGARISI